MSSQLALYARYSNSTPFGLLCAGTVLAALLLLALLFGRDARRRARCTLFSFILWLAAYIYLMGGAALIQSL